MHVQEPEWHACPSGHGGPLPQPHRPESVQTSAPTGEQKTQAVPDSPQVFNAPGWQKLAEQQPSGQLVALHRVHTPAVHASPWMQASHASPATPHSESESPSLQVLPLQHPKQER